MELSQAKQNPDSDRKTVNFHSFNHSTCLIGEFSEWDFPTTVKQIQVFKVKIEV